MEAPLPSLPAGFRAGALACGVRPSRERLDLGLLLADAATPAAAIFTRNRLLGAHVVVNREHLARSGGRVRALLVNARNANCSTGAEGIDDNRRVCGALAELVGCAPEEVLFQSTGVIGERLPLERLLAALPRLVDGLRADGLDSFSRAILTTDTGPKVAGVEALETSVVGVAKGSGMIHPDMATMLGYLLTDAHVAEGPALLRRVADRSFHRLSVDGDTSPNDAVVLWSSERRAAPAPALEASILDVARTLARRIAADGEGATRLVTIRVEGAASEADAVLAGRAIATSPLTKTAVAGRDPNWGRILAAAGRSGAVLDPDRARVWIGPALVYDAGRPRPDAERDAHRHLELEHEVVLGIDLGCGSASADVWTCDLTAEYVRINADYRT